ncbi:hypothetical protein LPJ53_004702 [Coemansia erecta]|uniref:G-protein coupled receptors family 3 profile domain-containing protein n=1 Tax=Coemansia erecta TaxID=147472 RepID=A0A9W8CRC1_9FUNG|nr:hypothetical protein LPJ53_004702 [Coemansia erecta]
MYYDYTPDEKERVEVAALFGINVHPVGYADLGAVIFFSVVLGIGLFANIYIWCNRHYAPLKAKNIPLMTGIYLHSVFFLLGDMTLCGLVHVRGPFFGNCILMLVWFRSMLGNFSLGALLTIRSYKFYRVFCKNKPVYGYMRAVPYILYFVIIGIVGFISTVVPRKMTMVHMDSVEFCIVNQHLVTTYSVMLWGMWAVYMVMMWLLRNVRSSFNEFKEMAISLIALVICTISNQALLYSVPLLPTVLHWRILLVAIDQFTANYIWWLIMLKPMYNCVFHHDTYLAYWKQKMTADGLRAQYGMGVADTELSVNSATFVARGQIATDKTDKTDPSFTESTRLAINQLAALSDSHNGDPDAPGSRWDSTNQGDATVQGENYFFRRSISFTQDYSRRKSEPYISTGQLVSEVGDTSDQKERRSRYRMLTQCVLSYHDGDSRISANTDKNNLSQNSLGVAGLRKESLDRSQGNKPGDCGIPTIVPTNTAPTLHLDLQPEAQSELRTTSSPSGLLPMLGRTDARLSNASNGNHEQSHGWPHHHQQHSDTDLSLLSSGDGYSGARQLL